jgi:heme-degrading monooxygenase HmoA
VLAEIRGAQNFEVLKQTNGKSDYRFALAMEFADQAAYDAYDRSPQAREIRAGPLRAGGQPVPRDRLRAAMVSGIQRPQRVKLTKQAR